MECRDATVSYLSWTLIVGGVVYLWHQTRRHTEYGRYVLVHDRCCPARLAWFVQEVPAFLLPLMQLLTGDRDIEPGRTGLRTGRTLLFCTFMLHYFHSRSLAPCTWSQDQLERSLIYAFLTRGRPVPLIIVLCAAIFCSLNGFLQGHHLLHCSRFEDTWLTDARLAAGFLLFVVGMSINIHSDHILRNLRKPGEIIYRIPRGGMFEFVSGANFFGEIVEWWGYALAVWSLPSFAFAFFTVCSIGPRAYQHHRDYQQRFKDYPRSRKALIPFLL